MINNANSKIMHFECNIFQHECTNYISDGSLDMLFAVFQPIETMDVYPCIISSIKQDYRKVGNGMVYQKDWPYTKLFNHQLYKVIFSCFTIENMKRT